MTASAPAAALPAQPGARWLASLRRADLAGLVITLVTLIAAVFWAFPLYWALVTTFKPEFDVVKPGVALWPHHFTLENYGHVLMETKIGLWYINSLITSIAVAVIVVAMAASAGYAISHSTFPSGASSGG